VRPRIVGNNESSITAVYVSDTSDAFYALDGRVVRNSVFNELTTNKYETLLAFNAARSNAIYGNSTKVQPPVVNALVAIRY